MSSLDELPFPACLLRSDGTISEANTVLGALLGYPNPEHLRGFPFRRLLVETDRQRWEATEWGRMGFFTLKGAKGESIPVNLGKWKKKRETMVALCPLPEGSESDHGFENATDSFFLQFSSRVFSEDYSRSPLLLALESLCDALGFAAAGIYLYDEEFRQYKLTEQAGMPEELTSEYAAIHASRFEAGASWPLVFADLPEYAPLSPTVKMCGFNANAVFPFGSEKASRGMLAVFDRLAPSKEPPLRSKLGAVEAVVPKLSHLVERFIMRGRMKENEVLYRSLVRSMPSGVMVRDREGRITHFNIAAERIFAVSQKEVLGSKEHIPGVQFFTREGESVSFQELPSLQVLTQGKPLRNRELQMSRKDGSSVWLSVNVEPLLHPNFEQPYAVVATFKDVSENRNFLRRLETAKRAAEEASKSKSQFLANISHEIRTPLSGIIGMTEILLSTEPSEQQRENLLLMKDAEDSLLEIINKVLELSKIETGRIRIGKKPFRLRSMVNRAAIPISVNCREKGLSLEMRIHSDIPDRLVGDSTRLQQVLTNLLSNAVKFTKKGSITVTVRPYGTTEDEEVHLLFSVLDTGIGISESDQLHIFEDFRQVDSSYSKEQQGTGLGLTISKELVELMGGRIWVESNRGKGSSFFFTLSFVKAEESAESEQDRTASDDTAAPAKEVLSILLAEDNELNQKSIGHLVRCRGHRVKIVPDGAQAVEEMKRAHYDVVLMDVQMPVLDGVEATKQIRNLDPSRGNPRIPIVALTAYAMKEDEVRFLAAGMDGYLTKPIDGEELFAAIESSLKGYSFLTPAAGTEPGRGGEGESPKENEVELTYFLKDYQGDVEIGRQLLELFIKDVPKRIAGAETALKAGEASALRDNLHSLTNNLSALRLYEIGTSFIALEKAVKRGDIAAVRSGFPKLKPRMLRAVEEAEKYRRLMSDRE
jgi:PAS domain S-box-containing protein